MLLRRLADSIKAQNWTAIWIEFILLVSGVFLGIQVSNWNAEREINKKSAVFTERLKVDLRQEAWNYEYLIEYNRDVLVNIEKVLEVMDGEASMSDEQFIIAAYRATQYKYNDRKRATYDEMVSTGSIDLIKDQKLRETAVVIFSTPLFEETSDEGKAAEYREIFRRSVSKDVQHALLKQCGDRYMLPLDYERIVNSLDYPCTLDLSAEKIRAATQSLRSQEKLVSALQLRFADVETALSDLVINNRVVIKDLRDIAGRKQ
jgi:hypothetical protein